MGSTTFGALYKQAKDDGAFDDVLPEGDFQVTLVKANSKDTKKGDASIGVQVKVTGGVDKDDPVFGKTAWTNLNFSKAAAPISFRQLRSWGFADDFLDESESAQQIADAIPGIVLDVSIKHRPWGANDENTAMDLKIHEVLTPPAVGAVATTQSTEADAGADDAGPEGY